MWKKLNRPLSDRAWNWVTVGGLLLFGLTGFIDMADGLGFPPLKVGATVLGVVVLIGLVIGSRRRRDS